MHEGTSRDASSQAWGTSDHIQGLPPDQLGHYRILRKIGEGGMGRVYEAQQDSPRRIVALKVLRENFGAAQAQKRFEHEAQVLGRLHHPYVAQIYEAGTAETVAGPQTFFAMELVRGVPLDEYMLEATLDLRARLALFIKICEGVEHAHQRGVVHRDLKPANILIDADGNPKILDFGVARLTDADVQAVTLHTDVGQLLGTLPYMSPEQVTGDIGAIDARSDVYALGVILYELLSGRRPYDVPRFVHEAVRVIRESEPSRLSSIDRVFRGDVETIVAKALEKERDRRYESARAFADDIERYLRDEPIVARPPSVAYQFRKFARRNKALVSGVVAVFVVLAAGVVASSLLALRAVRAEELSSRRRDQAVEAGNLAQERERVAMRERDKAQAVLGFLKSMLQGANPLVSRSRDLTVRELLDTSAGQLSAGELDDQPQVQAAILATLGKTYGDLGLASTAEPLLRRAMKLTLETEPRDEGLLADIECALGETLQYSSNFNESERLLRDAIALHTKLSGARSTDVADDLKVLSSTVYNLERRDEAEAIDRQALDIRVETLGAMHPHVAAAMATLAFHVAERRGYKEARALLDEAAEIIGTSKYNELTLSSVLKQRGRLLRDMGEHDAARADLERSLEVLLEYYGEKNTQVADVYEDLGTDYLVQGESEKAEKYLTRALELRRELLGDHRDTAVTLGQLATLAEGRLDFARALELSQEALDMRLKLYGEHSSATGDSYRRIGHIQLAAGDLDAAQSALERSLEIWNETLGPTHADLHYPLLDLARVHRARGDYDKAVELMRKALERALPIGEFASDAIEIRDDLAQCLLLARRWSEAEAMLRELLPKYEQGLRANHPMIDFARIQLGAALAGERRFEEAEELMLDAAERTLSNAALWAETKAMAANWVADLYRDWGRADSEAGWRERAASFQR